VRPPGASASAPGMLDRAMPDLGPAVETTLRRCLAVAAGEDVLVIVDPAEQGIGEALREGAARLGADAALLVMDERTNHGTEPAAPVAAAMAACDVFIAPTVKSLTHTEARRRACEAGARGATMPGVTADMLARVMAIDFDQMAARSSAVAELLSRASTAHVSCPDGTDLTLNLAGRDGAADDGDLTERGAFGNLPAGEGFISPLDAAGTIVPASLAGIGLVHERPRLKIEDGRLAVATGAPGDALLRLLEPYGELGRNVAELGIGTNESATLTGNVLEDEKVLGSVHLAFGASAGLGGSVSVPIHLDVVVVDVSLTVDGRPVLDAGRYVLDA
jgi:leucyl aminopeptidase (aminopeptidase T)